MLYKQQKFNLLREESEGYSKLEVELLSSMGSPHSNRTAQPSEPYVASHPTAAKQSFSQVTLIFGLMIVSSVILHGAR